MRDVALVRRGQWELESRALKHTPALERTHCSRQSWLAHAQLSTDDSSDTRRARELTAPLAGLLRGLALNMQELESESEARADTSGVLTDLLNCMRAVHKRARADRSAVSASGSAAARGCGASRRAQGAHCETAAQVCICGGAGRTHRPPLLLSEDVA